MESFTDGVFTAIKGGGSLETALAGAGVATGAGTENKWSRGCCWAKTGGAGVGVTSATAGESKDTRSGDDSTRRGLSTFKAWTSGSSDALCWWLGLVRGASS